jgi:hypothetical protein
MAFLQKYIYDGPKYMLGIRINLYLNLFMQIRILESTMVVHAMNFLSRSPSCVKIRQICEL